MEAVFTHREECGGGGGGDGCPQRPQLCPQHLVSWRESRPNVMWTLTPANVVVVAVTPDVVNRGNLRLGLSIIYKVMSPYT